MFISCNENNIVENEDEIEKRKIDLFAKYVIGDSTYLFDSQWISDRFLSIISMGNKKGIYDSILIGYNTRFAGGDNYLDLFINKKFLVADLENKTNNLSGFVYSESAWGWTEYEPTKSKFESMFCPGKRNMLNGHYYWTEEEGVALFINDFRWTSYDQFNKNVSSSDWQVNSNFEINSVEHLTNEQIENLATDGGFSPVYADNNRHYLLIDLSFNVKMYNEKDSTKMLELRDGNIRAIVYK